MERLVEIERVSFEEKDETSLRPAKFSEYIGQENIKKISTFLSIYVYMVLSYDLWILRILL